METNISEYKSVCTSRKLTMEFGPHVYFIIDTLNNHDLFVNINISKDDALRLASEINKHYGVEVREPHYQPKVGDWVELMWLKDEDVRVDGLEIGCRYIVVDTEDQETGIFVSSYHRHYCIHDSTQLKKCELPKESE